MKLEELEMACLEAAKARLRGITLTFPAGTARPLGFPRGEHLSTNGAGETNYSYDPLRVLAWVRDRATK